MKNIFILFFFLFSLSACNDNTSSGNNSDTTKNSSSTNSLTNTPGSGIMIPPDTDTATALNSIGDLVLGMKTSPIMRMFGRPDSVSKTGLWPGDGLMHQDWLYRSRGISLNMAMEEGQKDMFISSITVKKPCTLKTQRGIGIGSVYAEVMMAYEKEIDQSLSKKNVIVIGSIYDGIIVSFENDKASNIFIGAAAE
ncbi:MAG: hypothetical protein GC171_11540 [Terrimonas sp.]|nr:hypothetical protein [Terrimonas sp.]